jgi:predicted permease
MGELWRRVWYLLNRSRFRRELRDEMEAHRDMAGANGARFGNSLRLADEAGDEWGWGWLDRLDQDLRFAGRLWLRAPAFTATAVSVIAVGGGVTLAAFQILDCIALSWLPVRSPETLVTIYRRSPRGTSTSFSYPAFDFYRRTATSLAGAMATVHGSVTLGDDETRRIDAEFVSATYFSELGGSPLAGRLLDVNDEASGAEAALVLSEEIWRGRFGGDPSLVGRPVNLNGRPFTVAGIVPRTFTGVDDPRPAAWIPISHHRTAFPGSRLLDDWGNGPVRFFARVGAGAATRAAAEAELRSRVDGLRAIQPQHVWDDEWLAILPAGRYVLLQEAAPALALVGALIVLVFVAACMNLGLLVLARTLGRDREFAIRLSVGATGGRIVRQLLTEHILLGAIGALAGCLVATQISQAFLTFVGAPGGLVPRLNPRAMIVAAALAVFSSVLFGFGPAFQALRPAAPRRFRLRSALVGVQVAAASTLLIVSGLLTRGVTQVVRVPLGFDYAHTLVADPALVSHGVAAEAAQTYWRENETRIRQLPGVRNVALTTLPPFGNRVNINRIRAVFYDVDPAYFDTMQIPLVRGRLFEPGERGVALVSEALARRQWPSEDPLGKVYEGATIIGVVGNARTVRIGERGATECYRPIAERQFAEAVLVVRAEGSLPAVASAVEAAMRRTDERLTPAVTLLEQAFESKLETPRRIAMIASSVGACTLLLAVVGLAGMVAFTVSQRLREIGIRLALGAGPAHVVRAVGRQFAWPVALGAIAGSALAALAGTILSRELFGVSAMDPLSHGGALLLFAVIAALSSLPSLRRAVRLDPIETLRHE